MEAGARPAARSRPLSESVCPVSLRRTLGLPRVHDHEPTSAVPLARPTAQLRRYTNCPKVTCGRHLGYTIEMPPKLACGPRRRKRERVVGYECRASVCVCGWGAKLRCSISTLRRKGIIICVFYHLIGVGVFN